MKKKERERAWLAAAQVESGRGLLRTRKKREGEKRTAEGGVFGRMESGCDRSWPDDDENVSLQDGS